MRLLVSSAAFQPDMRSGGIIIVECPSSKEALNKALNLGATAIGLDIVTDVFSLSNP